MAAPAIARWPGFFDMDELLEQLDEFEGWHPDRPLSLASVQKPDSSVPVSDRNNPR